MSANNNLKPNIRIENLKHVYPAGNTALEEINLTFYPGEFVAIIGQNGAGKTTLTKHLNGLLKATKGDVYIDDVNVKSLRVSQWAKKIGYCFQNPDHQIFSENVWEEVAFGPRRIGMNSDEVTQSVEETLQRLELSNQREAHPYTLSKGQRQRVAVASVVAMKPEILVVDEPTTGQDYKQSREIMNIFVELNKEGKTVLVVTHDMRLVAQYASRTVVMGLGKILLDDITANVFNQTDILHQTHLRPPQITTTGFRLGLDQTILSTRQMVEYFKANPI
jgi:energy-coupling factor transporter ATP-binding protein EcfA2